MKKIVVVIVFALGVFNGFAQESSIDPKFASYMIETERRTVFLENMNLTPEEAAIFGVIYEAFEAELKEIRESGMKNLNKYANEYATLTNEQAAEIMKVSLANDTKRAAIRKKYYNKVAKQLGEKVAARFIQLDSIVYMVLRLSIFDEIPLVGDDK